MKAAVHVAVLRDCLPFSFLILNKFKRINFFSPWNYLFSDNFRGTEVNLSTEIWLMLEAKFGDDL